MDVRAPGRERLDAGLGAVVLLRSSAASSHYPRPPNKRFKLAARVDCGMDFSSARRSL